MRVCFVCPGASSIVYPELPPTHGGAEAQLHWCATAMAKLPGADVHFVVNGDRQNTPRKIGDVTYHHIEYKAGLGAKLRLLQTLNRVGADCYIQRGIGSLTKEVAFFCLCRGKKFVYWIASDFDVDPTTQSPGLARPASFIWGMRRAKLILSQSKFQTKKLRENIGREAEVILNSLPPRPLIEEPRDRLLWIGRMSPVKRPELFLELAEHIPNVSCVMIAPITSDGATKIYDRLKEKIERLPNLTFIPGVPLEETYAHFSKSKMLVNTSISEGFPNTFIQAMWCGVPLASIKFDSDGIIDGHDLGVGPKGDDDVGQFAQQIQALLDKPERWERCSRNVRQYAETHHNIDVNAQKLFERLREMDQPQ